MSAALALPRSGAAVTSTLSADEPSAWQTVPVTRFFFAFGVRRIAAVAPSATHRIGEPVKIR